LVDVDGLGGNNSGLLLQRFRGVQDQLDAVADIAQDVDACANRIPFRLIGVSLDVCVGAAQVRIVVHAEAFQEHSPAEFSDDFLVRPVQSLGSSQLVMGGVDHFV
jgi:hypothetical protein